MNDYKWFYDSSDNPMTTIEKDRKWVKYNDKLNKVIGTAYIKYTELKENNQNENLESAIFEYIDEETCDKYMFNFITKYQVKNGTLTTVFCNMLDYTKDIEIIDYYFDYPKLAAGELNNYIEILYSLSLHLELMWDRDLRDRLSIDFKILVFLNTISFVTTSDNQVSLFHYLLYGPTSHGGYFNHIISNNAFVDKIYINKTVLKLNEQEILNLVRINLLYYTLLLTLKYKNHNNSKVFSLIELLNNENLVTLTYIKMNLFDQEVSKIIKENKIDISPQNNYEKHKEYLNELFKTTFDVSGELTILIELLNEFAKGTDCENENVILKFDSTISDELLDQSILNSLEVDGCPKYRISENISNIQHEGWYHFDKSEWRYINNIELCKFIDLVIIKYREWKDLNEILENELIIYGALRRFLDYPLSTEILLKRYPLFITFKQWQQTFYEYDANNNIIFHNFKDDINLLLNEADLFCRQKAEILINNIEYIVDLSKCHLIEKIKQNTSILRYDINHIQVKASWMYSQYNNWYKFIKLDNELIEDTFGSLKPPPEVYFGNKVYTVDYLNTMMKDQTNPMSFMSLRRLLEIEK
jgi:hypothetical protein